MRLWLVIMTTMGGLAGLGVGLYAGIRWAYEVSTHDCETLDLLNRRHRTLCPEARHALRTGQQRP